jgi:hypothetical protein
MRTQPHLASVCDRSVLSAAPAAAAGNAAAAAITCLVGLFVSDAVGFSHSFSFSTPGFSTSTSLSNGGQGGAGAGGGGGGGAGRGGGRVWRLVGLVCAYVLRGGTAVHSDNDADRGVCFFFLPSCTFLQGCRSSACSPAAATILTWTTPPSAAPRPSTGRATRYGAISLSRYPDATLTVRARNITT